MAKNTLIALVAYDLAIHVAHIIKPREWWIRKRLIFWPPVYGKTYNIFWAAYWSIGLLCAIACRKQRSHSTA